MIQVALLISSGFLALALVFSLIRFFRGPTALNRILGFDLISIVVVGFVILISIYWGVGEALDLLLIYSLLGFVTTVAFIDNFLRSGDA